MENFCETDIFCDTQTPCEVDALSASFSTIQLRKRPAEARDDVVVCLEDMLAGAGKRRKFAPAPLRKRRAEDEAVEDDAGKRPRFAPAPLAEDEAVEDDAGAEDEAVKDDAEKRPKIARHVSFTDVDEVFYFSSQPAEPECEETALALRAPDVRLPPVRDMLLTLLNVLPRTACVTHKPRVLSVAGMIICVSDSEQLERLRTVANGQINLAECWRKAHMNGTLDDYHYSFARCFARRLLEKRARLMAPAPPAEMAA